VLAAPDEISSVNAPRSAVMKLVGLAREQFPYVVVDAGSRPGELLDALFEAASVVYLVAQVSVADLRNANRLVRRYFAGASAGNPQIVLNRFQTRGLEIDEAAITKALGRPVNWKIPNDYAAARKAQNTGVAIASQDNQLSRVFADMAHRASGVGLPESKRKKFGLF
jgi:pilus assembly protein CpaE